MRGAQEERELAKMLMGDGFATMRSPASGSKATYPLPDLVAGSSSRGLHYAFQVKTTKRRRVYIPRESIDQLVEFSQRFGCQPIVALKFKGTRRPWVFLRPNQLKTTPSRNYKITLKEALQRGVDLKTLIGGGEQKRLVE